MLTADVTKICKEHSEMRKLIKHIQDALGTAETGEALIEVARNAHKAELELASTYEGCFDGDELVLTPMDDKPFDVMSTIDPDHSDTFK